MSEYAKNIQTIEDMWKKRIELREEDGGRMSEYIYQSRGEPLANERGEIHLARTGEIVRCRDCRYYDTHTEPPECYREVPGRIVAPDGFCKWGERK